jgi:hypothetical protein
MPTACVRRPVGRHAHFVRTAILEPDCPVTLLQSHHANPGGPARSATSELDRVFEQLIISRDVDRAPNGIGYARVARVLLIQPL